MEKIADKPSGDRARGSKLRNFFLRYYIGHKGKYGHEFLEFEFQHDGMMRYANNSNYKSDCLIRKEVFVNDIVLEELIRIIEDSEIFKEDDSDWPKPDKNGKQELEIRIGDEKVYFKTSKFGSFLDIEKSKDPDGQRTNSNIGSTLYYYLLQDIKCFVFSLLNMRFRIKPF
mmetsp:Transcript_38531/g.44163  ORF Transcript_38531/g.44163 Transcript_38531/m.44163 type:complete len:171 (-) Transcript_38531:64-576(-)